MPSDQRPNERKIKGRIVSEKLEQATVQCTPLVNGIGNLVRPARNGKVLNKIHCHKHGMDSIDSLNTSIRTIEPNAIIVELLC